MECCGQSREIYYTSLLPFDLDQLLQKVKSGNKTRNINLTEIPSTHFSELETICREFLMHRKQQFSLPGFIFPHDKVKGVMMQGVMSAKVGFEEMLLSNSHYLYGKLHLDSLVYECVTKINIEEIRKTLDRPISIGSKEYYPD